MATIKNPVRFSDHFGIAESEVQRLGILNPTLNADTRLFIDPLLLSLSEHPEIRDGARAAYEAHFISVIKLLRGSTSVGDVAWRSARRHLAFPEIRWTCLGYGAASVSGSGSGSDMTEHLVRTAKQIVDLGVVDPDLFVAMALFEDGFGPDRISDMTTNVILGDLLKFSVRITHELKVPTQAFTLRLKNGAIHQALLPSNSYLKPQGPIIFVPTDILRDLPIAADWSEVADAASKSAEIRDRVNKDIAELWRRKSRKDKAKIRQWALSDKDSFESFLAMIREADHRPYDVEGDPNGELYWRHIAATLATQEPLSLKVPAKFDLASVANIVDQIIAQFRFLIEQRRFSEELYHQNHPRPEKSAQRLFFAVAYSYCKANNLDITPEADTGNGPVDFKVSSGFAGRVLVEIKLSTNSKVVPGYERQLATYKSAEETQKGYYIVLDVGQMGKKAEQLFAAKNRAVERGEPVSDIVIIDGSRKQSASKL